MARTRKKKKKNEEEEEGVDPNGWMVTFSDLLTLLMTFFVLLLSMSSMDTKALKSMFSMFVGAANVLYFAELSGVEHLRILQPKISPDEIQKILERIMDDYVEGKLDYTLAQNEISVLSKKNSVFVTFPENIIFENSSAKIRKDLIPLLKDIIGIIKQTDYLVRIEGHTDNTPSKSKVYFSNWELSAMRAANVMKFFLEEKIPSERLFAVGYNKFKPVFPNSNPKFRSKNRRVEIILERVLG